MYACKIKKTCFSHAYSQETYNTQDIRRLVFETWPIITLHKFTRSSSPGFLSLTATAEDR